MGYHGRIGILFISQNEFSGQIRHFLLANMLPETGGKIISRYVEQFTESAALLAAVDIVLLGVCHDAADAYHRERLQYDLARVTAPGVIWQRHHAISGITCMR